MSILTLSRQFGCGHELGRSIASRMGYQYVDRGVILEDLRKVGPKWEDWAKELDEHCPTFWEKHDWSFRGFTALMQAEILQYALKDRVVIMGRGSNFLLEGIDSAYRVRLVGPAEYRIAVIMERDSLDLATAKWLLKKTDAERAGFISSIYGKQLDDRSGYDAIFDMSNTSIDDLIPQLIEILNKKDSMNTAEVKDALRMRASAAKVKAGIATNPTFFLPVLDVCVAGGSLVMRGVTHTAKEHKRLKEEATKLAGNVPIQFELHYR
jgi:cytidylate kinase